MLELLVDLREAVEEVFISIKWNYGSITEWGTLAGIIRWVKLYITCNGKILNELIIYLLGYTSRRKSICYRRHVHIFPFPGERSIQQFPKLSG